MKMFTLSNDTVQALATLHHATADKAGRDMTPILGAVQLVIDHERWTATATDRYVVAEISGEMTDHAHTLGGDSVEILINSNDLVDLAKRVKRSRIPVVFKLSDESIECDDYNDTRITYRTMSGNYPPVTRLFPEVSKLTESAGFGIDPNKLARLGKVHSWDTVTRSASERNTLPLHLRFVASEYGNGPIYATRSLLESNLPYRALIQPNKLIGQ